MNRIALSLWQPWATYIVQGRKTIETRMWATNYRGPLVICSTASPAVEGHLCGYALGIAELVACRPMRPADETAAMCTCDPGRYAWVLQDVRQFVRPFRVRGRQGLWPIDLPVDIELARACE